MLNKYDNPAERVYTRLSAGLYEDMFRGVGGQVLYLPKDSRWAADLAVDALQQRGFDGVLSTRDYKTVTALASLHYRLPHDMTVTARAGRFLAKDDGVRLEFKRRFQSGIEVGAWYTHTNGNDITTPGTPSKPYQDRGVFPVGATEQHAADGYAGQCRLCHFAMDARRGPDGCLAWRSVRHD